MEAEISGYDYTHAGPTDIHRQLLPVVFKLLQQRHTVGCGVRIFELGCGSGYTAAQLSLRGYDVTAVDTSSSGIALARTAYPDLKIYQASAYDDLRSRFGRFPVVLSLEVVEHLYFPRRFASAVYSLLEGGGTAIISTPYHGYAKNLAMAITGRMDEHFTALWDHGHIKFWSHRSLRKLLEEAGLTVCHFLHVGRISPLAKTMIVVAKRR